MAYTEPEINFRNENGFAPYFLYKNLKFFIQDEKKNTSNYKYVCYVKKIDKKVLNFKDDKEAVEYVQKVKGIKYVCKYDGRSLYVSILADFIVCGNTVTIRNTPSPLTGDYDSYADCLMDAKTKVAEYIRFIEPEQFNIFNLKLSQ